MIPFMKIHPEYKMGETVVVPFKEDETILFLGKIIGATLLTDTKNEKWGYKVMLDCETKHTVSYDEMEIQKVNNHQIF